MAGFVCLKPRWEECARARTGVRTYFLSNARICAEDTYVLRKIGKKVRARFVNEPLPGNDAGPVSPVHVYRRKLHVYRRKWKFFIKSAMFLTKIGVFSSNQLYFHYGCTDENSILRHSLPAPPAATALCDKADCRALRWELKNMYFFQIKSDTTWNQLV